MDAKEKAVITAHSAGIQPGARPDMDAAKEGDKSHLKTESSEVIHIVLFRWNEDAAPEAIAAAVEALRGLKETIPGILDLSVGANFSDRAKGYHHALVVRFPDRAALEAYGPHPNHQYVVQNFTNPIRADVLAFDYEI